jgi:NhaA family Na+:H+ antiporter
MTKSTRHKADGPQPTTTRPGSKDALAAALLVACAALALVIANSSSKDVYENILHIDAGVWIGRITFSQSLLHWVNDGLMAAFFLGVGLEIKHDFLTGHLSRPGAAIQPVFGAAGGMIMPCVIYLIINAESPAALAGWAIPSATDIGFAVGVLALFGSRVPPALKTFLVALAIIDDLGAIVIIAAFYTDQLSLKAFVGAGAILLGLYGLNRAGVRHPIAYLLPGIVLWACVLESGVHATLAGVALAFVMPSTGKGRTPSPSALVEHALQPWILFFILPAFALANAGLSFDGLTTADFSTSIPLGILLGLSIGKPVGVLGGAFMGRSLNRAQWPGHVSLWAMVGISALCGIGFTMSLFIGSLAFDDPQVMRLVRLGVISGSALSGLLGASLLHFALPPKPSVN